MKLAEAKESHIAALQKIQEEESKREELRHILKAAANDTIPFIILKDQLQALKHQLTVEGKLKQNRLFKDKFSDPHLKEKLQQEMKVGIDSPQIELSDEFMLALYKTLREDISEHEMEFLQISENYSMELLATVYKGNIIKNLIMDCQSYTKYRPNETTGGIFVSWRRKEELPTGA